MADGGPLKVMYLNPVGTPDYDEVFAAMARGVKLPGTEVHVTSLQPADGAFTHIEYRSYEAVVSTGIVRAARAAAAEGFDALAIGCFYDTALHEAREVSGEMVVTAPCSASLEIAASLANRFGIIVGRRKWVHQMHATVRDIFRSAVSVVSYHHWQRSDARPNCRDGRTHPISPRLRHTVGGTRHAAVSPHV